MKLCGANTGLAMAVAYGIIIVHMCFCMTTDNVLSHMERSHQRQAIVLTEMYAYVIFMVHYIGSYTMIILSNISIKDHNASCGRCVSLLIYPCISHPWLVNIRRIPMDTLYIGQTNSTK